MPEQTNNNSQRRRRQQPVDNTYAHVQPQATEIERAVLGALMIDKDAYAVVCEMLTPESFYEPRNQKVYAAVRELSMHESPVDVWTVTEQLAKQGDLEDVGGPGYITELSSRVASSANVEYHARIIAQKSLARQLISFASVIETKAFDETVDVDELMQEAEGSLFELGQRNMKKDYTQIDPVIRNAIDIIQKAGANKDGLTGVSTGYHKLDDITSGWQPSDLVIIAGRPAMGKTSFALSMAKNIAADLKVPMAFFSLEMSNVQLVNRLISNCCEIQGSKILNGQLRPDEWERLDKRLNNLLGAPLYVDDTPSLSVFELRTKARRLVREHGVKIIMIDYLQLMNASGMRFSSRQEEVSTISRSLKGLAKELDVPILALSHSTVVWRAVRALRVNGPSSQTSVNREPSSRMPIWCCLYTVRNTIISIRMRMATTSVAWHRLSLPSIVRVLRAMCSSTSGVSLRASRILKTVVWVPRSRMTMGVRSSAVASMVNRCLPMPSHPLVPSTRLHQAPCRSKA